MDSNFTDEELKYIDYQVNNKLTDLELETVFGKHTLEAYRKDDKIQTEIINRKLAKQNKTNEAKEKKTALQIEQIDKLAPHAIKGLWTILQNPQHKDFASVCLKVLSGELAYKDSFGKFLAEKESMTGGNQQIIIQKAYDDSELDDQS
jgi:hypothetical protein